MKKIYSLVFMLMAAFMLSSCIIVTEDGTVSIENRDKDRSAYISKVEYREENSYSWNECWRYTALHTDSDINFSLTSGYYKLRVTVIYPKYDGYRDYYDTFESENYRYISSFSDTVYIFDGEYLYQ